MRLAVHAAGEPAHDDETRGGELTPDQARHLAAVRRAGAGADDRDRREAQQLDLPGSAQEEPGRRVVQLSQQRREPRLGAADEAQALL